MQKAVDVLFVGMRVHLRLGCRVCLVCGSNCILCTCWSKSVLCWYESRSAFCRRQSRFAVVAVRVHLHFVCAVYASTSALCQCKSKSVLCLYESRCALRVCCVWEKTCGRRTHTNIHKHTHKMCSSCVLCVAEDPFLVGVPVNLFFLTTRLHLLFVCERVGFFWLV